jgi:hypothetical protein
MAGAGPFMQRRQNYCPSRNLVVLVDVERCHSHEIIVGFSYGGWTKTGAPNNMVQNAASHARSTLASSVCVQKFGSTDTSEKLAELKRVSSRQRDDFIDDGGWSKLAGMENPSQDHSSCTRMN